MKEIKLTQGKVALVDDEDYEYLSQFRWFLFKGTNGYYAITGTGNPRRSIYMHRLIMDTPKGLQVDHIDHNGLNNQRFNLRNCTGSQNQRNKRGYGKSEYIGVSLMGNKYRAYIFIDGNIKYLGLYDTEREAAIKRDTVAKKYFGEYANLNIQV